MVCSLQGDPFPPSLRRPVSDEVIFDQNVFSREDSLRPMPDDSGWQVGPGVFSGPSSKLAGQKIISVNMGESFLVTTFLSFKTIYPPVMGLAE